MVGRQPQAVLDAIRANAGNVAGKNVILSTGASNNPKAVEAANRQIEELLKAGAKRVTVVGVGTKKNLQEVNERLRDISSAHGPNVRFLGPLSGLSRDRVHPRDYKKLAEEASSE
jgi:glycosyltransferase involved in cell wall biosynthesis